MNLSATDAKRYQLTARASLEVRPCNGGIRMFRGKTERLALYSLRACGREWSLYVKRDWRYAPWESTEE